MSDLVVPSRSLVDEIPLHRRIREIMEERGKYYSIQAMATRLGLSRDTYWRMLHGKREIYTFELEKIARDLKMPAERILQADTVDEYGKLKSMLDQQVDPTSAVEIAKVLLETASGLSERCHALHRLGQAYFDNQSYDEAFDIINEAYELADKIRQIYKEDDRLFEVLLTQMNIYTAKHEYWHAARILDSVHQHFHKTATKLAAVNYLQAKIKESVGDYGTARAFAYDSMTQAEASGNKILLGKTLVNVAHYEYLQADYHLSKETLEKAVRLLSEDRKSMLIAMKEMAKSLLKLGDSQQAETLILHGLEEVKHFEFPVMEGKLWLLLARCMNEPNYAEFVINKACYGKRVRYLACRFLIRHYRIKDDSQKVMFYYEIGEELSEIPSDILDEGEL